MRQFYGLPYGVSNVTLALLFPSFSLVHKVVLGKVRLLLRGLTPLPTVLPEALVYDRGCLFEKHRLGFTQILRDWGQQLGHPDLVFLTDCTEVKGILSEAKVREMEGS